MGLQSVIEHRGTLGRTEFSVVRTDGVRKLTIGDWSTTLTPETQLRHRNRWLCMEIRVAQPGRPEFVHRYHINWFLQLHSPFEWDYLIAEMDDPGLELVESLGGVTDWIRAESTSY
ncbi:hypothetical protein [Streptomyces sp. bgisy060]|uniref:hypothetical protein n=1 Tax=Streptomyces sp. bgisy060 TaxID=3413775 RepID=UPI003EB84E38